ncbi:MAG TPA: alkaline phosphatase family protein [Solirubrobacteraceae bacterium]|nr:alkaline phosphatase family protein [Solirubrobacteraceae bacterium]
MRQRRTVGGLAAALALTGGGLLALGGTASGAAQASTATPIKHLVVIFQENVSFDHYFATYPHAAGTDGQRFKAAKGTPAVDGLAPATAESIPPALRHSDNLLFSNPNAAQPQRLDSNATGLPGDAGGQLTCDQDHNYSDEQQSFDGGAMDRFVQSVGTGSGTTPFGAPCAAAQVMDYYDGNTVTALWNYAQRYAMSDNSYGTTFGPSAPGAINLVAGDTGEVDAGHLANSPSIATSTAPNADLTANGLGGYALTSDAQPYWDDCSTRDAVAMKGTNIGDELNAKGLSWGWFQGGMKPNQSYAEALAATGHSGQPTSAFEPDEFKTYYAATEHRPAHSSNQANCSTVHPVGVALGGTGQWGYKDDYIAHHEPFQYYASTANPHHLTIPAGAGGQDTLAGLQEIGHDTQSYAAGVPQFNTPNHQYDTSDFNQLVEAIGRRELPASALPDVSFIKAPGYQDGHGAYSDPADEQAFIASTINELMRSPDWQSTAVVVNYDDSDGWYDHAYSGVTNPSLSAADNLTNTSLTVSSTGTSGQCGANPQTVSPLGGEQGRCGFGPRLPLLVISPYAKRNAVDHNVSNQASMINFVEYNWGLPGIPGSADQVQAGVDASEGVPFDLAGSFDFAGKRNGKLFLNPATGEKQG